MSDEHLIRWSCRVAINLHIDATRKQRRVSLDPPPDIADTCDTARTVEQSQASRSLRDTVRRQIDVATAAAVAVDRAVQDNDRRTVAMSVQRFAAAHEVLRKLEDSR